MSLQAGVMTMIERAVEQSAKLRTKNGPPKIPRPLLEIAYPPATESDLRSFSKKYGFSLPDDLCSWLLCHNGGCLGQGRCYGVNPVDLRLSVEEIYSDYREWPRLRWIPVGDDSCGNYYVQVIRSAPPHPIAFIDTMQDPNKVAYCVASGVWQFLWFSLTGSEATAALAATQTYTPSFWWPFDRKRVLEVDPALKLITDLPLPWSSAN